jgi:hypothetical protein
MFANPSFWPTWPYLSVLRRPADLPPEFGLLFDACGISQEPFFTATVFMADLTDTLRSQSEFLSLPRYVYRSIEELADNGWLVD